MNYNELISKFHEDNPINKLIESGYTPEQIKSMIIERFSPYIHDSKLLKENAIEHLVSTWVLYERITHVTTLSNVLDDLVKVCDIQHEKQKIIAAKSYVDHMEILDDSTNKYWSNFAIEDLSKNEAELTDFAVRILSIIGHLVEYSIKPYLQLYMYLLKIKADDYDTINSVPNINLGILIKELSIPLGASFLKVHGLALNQWRNIAYHNDFRLKLNSIQCFYGKAKSNTISLTKKELFEVAIHINRIGSVFKIAESIFLFNNLQYIRAITSKNSQKEPNLRKESKLMDFYSKLSTQGFKTISLDVDERNTILIIEDLSKPNKNLITKRKIHSSQFLLQLWMIFNSKKTTIRYRLPHRNISFSSLVNGEICNKIVTGAEHPSSLVDNVEFEDHNNK